MGPVGNLEPAAMEDAVEISTDSILRLVKEGQLFD